MIEWTDTTGYVRHSDVSARLDPTNSNTLLLALPRSWSEISRIDDMDRFYIHTQYDAPTPPDGYDETYVATGRQPITDPIGDVNYDLVDIVSGSWNTQLMAKAPPIDVARYARADGEKTQGKRSLVWSRGKWSTTLASDRY